MITSQVLADENIQVQIVEPYIELHSGPAGGFPVIHVAAKNEWITVLKRRTNWFKVETNKGVQGWIKQEALHLTQSSSGESVRLADGSFELFSERDFEFGALGGSFEGVPAMTVFADWVATENLIAGITVTQALGDLSENQLFLIRLQHTTFPDWRLSPYVTLGAGKIRTTPRANLVQSGDETRTSDLLAAGLGLRYYMAQNFILKLEYQHLQALTDIDENEDLEQWKLGFAVFF
ncbi:SH3 domain-containing protein [uncultured Paraglaciecola sp.]|uniref:SH3 domain-containing protein n=1 Tax=uncultured Paraglaciecola sp. TaxID=1765024 RepID=UPI0030DA3E69